MILILGGTTEGKDLFCRLQKLKVPCLMSVASEYASQLVPEKYIDHIRVGKLGLAEMEKLLKNEQAAVVVDATHPFAVEASRNAMEAANSTGVLYVRLERDLGGIPEHPAVEVVDELAEISNYLSPGKVVFSTLGSKHLDELSPLIKDAGCRLVARVLPQEEVMQKCLALGLEPADIVAMQGVFSKGLNREIFSHFGADWLITKESGREGGQDSKIQAALELQMQVVVWRRPELDYPLSYTSVDELVEKIIKEYLAEVKKK